MSSPLLIGEVIRSNDPRVKEISKHDEDDQRRTLYLALIDNSYEGSDGSREYLPHINMRVERGTNIIGEPMDSEWEEVGVNFRCNGFALDRDASSFYSTYESYSPNPFLDDNQLIKGMHWLLANTDSEQWKSRKIIMPKTDPTA